MRKDELTVDPFTGPTRTGEPAYTYMGVQMLKSVVDKHTDDWLYTRMVLMQAWVQKHAPERIEYNLFGQILVDRLIKKINTGG